MNAPHDIYRRAFEAGYRDGSRKIAFGMDKVSGFLESAKGHIAANPGAYIGGAAGAVGGGAAGAATGSPGRRLGRAILGSVLGGGAGAAAGYGFDRMGGGKPPAPELEIHGPPHRPGEQPHYRAEGAFTNLPPDPFPDVAAAQEAAERKRNIIDAQKFKKFDDPMEREISDFQNAMIFGGVDPVKSFRQSHGAFAARREALKQMADRAFSSLSEIQDRFDKMVEDHRAEFSGMEDNPNFDRVLRGIEKAREKAVQEFHQSREGAEVRRGRSST